MTRLQRFCAPLWAFLLTLGLLLGVGGAMRVEYVTHRTLHGEAASWDVAAWGDAARHLTDTAEALLSPRCRVVTAALRELVEAIAVPPSRC